MSSATRRIGLAVPAVAALVVLGVGCNGKSSPSSGLAVVSTSAEPEPTGPPLFEDVTAKTGINFTYRNGEEANNFAIIESVGGGVALFDFDGDGRLDVFLPGGGHYDGKRVLGNPCKLYRNLGDWKFEDVTEKVGLAGPVQYTHGAAAFDYDNDGWPDLLLTGYNRLFLFHNEPDGKGGRHFVDMTAKAGLADAMWSTSAGWGDLDGDGYPEIYVAHYGDWGFDTNHPTDCNYDGKTRDVCQPRRFNPLPHTLYRNNRNGTFTDVSAKVLPKKLGRGLGVLFFDADGDGKPDIYVCNDTDDNFLLMNRGNKGDLALEENGVLAGVARDDRGWANGSMGVDAGDFDHSGRPSVIVTNYENELPALYQNFCEPGKKVERFTFATMATGLSAVTGAYVSWGTGFLDAEHRGWEDLLIVSGHAIRYPSKTDRRQKPQFLHNTEGRFQIASRQAGAYFREPHNARGAAVGDLDNDGKQDLVISHLNEPAVILRNVAPTEGRHWVGIQLVGAKNRDVVGTRVVLEGPGGKQARFAKGGGSFASTNDRRLVFGLGNANEIGTVTVYWPWGGSQKFTDLRPDSYWRLVEGDATAHKVEAPKP